MFKQAVIDIGSNTIRLNVYLVDGEKLNLLFGKKIVAGLASYVEDGVLTKKGIQKLEASLKSLMAIINVIDVKDLYIFATASLRNVENTKEIIERIKTKLNLDIILLSDKEEARLGFRGIREVYNAESGISVDIGGGSVEIILFQGEKIKIINNMSEGSLSLFSKNVDGILPTPREIGKIDTKIKKILSDFNDEIKYETLVGIGGTIRACGNIISELYDKNDEDHFTYEELEDFFLNIKRYDRKTIRTVLKTAPQRLHTITTGMIILLNICEKYGVKNIVVCNYGLREGFLLNKLEDKS